MFDWSARVTPVSFSPLPKSPHKMLPLSDWALINYAKCVCGEELTWLVIWVASQNTNSWQSFYWKYQFRASVYNVVWYVWEWWESPNSHSHVRWSQMKWKHRSHSTPHKLWNYSKYFNYWVRMDPIWNAVDFVGKFNTGFTYLGINYDFIQTSQLSHRINSDLDPISRYTHRKSWQCEWCEWNKA